MKTITLHLGYHKTGTTTIQNVLDDLSSLEHSKFIYIGKWNGREEVCHPDVQNFVDQFSMGEVPPQTLHIFKNRILHYFEVSGKNHAVLSYERLLRPSNFLFLEGLFRALKRTFFDFQVNLLVSTRPLEELIVSRFLHDVRGYQHPTTMESELFSCRQRRHREYNSEDGEIFEAFINNTVPYGLKDALRCSFECNYPLCKKGGKCVCDDEYLGAKEINPQFYDIGELTKKLKGLIVCSVFVKACSTIHASKVLAELLGEKRQLVDQTFNRVGVVNASERGDLIEFSEANTALIKGYIQSTKEV